MSLLRTIVCAALAALVLTLPGCSSREEYVSATIDDAREAAGRRDYERAQELIDRALESAGEDFGLLFEKADTYRRAREFDRAVVWFGRAWAVDPSSWESLVGRWEAEYRAAGESETVEERVLGEASSFLAGAPDSLVNLCAAVSIHAALGREDAVDDARERLMTLFPDSDLGSDLIKEDVDWIGVERDDERRLEMADAFLERHPATSWRPKVMRLKLTSLERLERFDDVETLVTEWASEHSDDPEILNVLAASLVSCDRAPDQASGLARRAVELELLDCEASGLRLESRGPRTHRVAGVAGPGDVDIKERQKTLSDHHLTLARSLSAAGDFPSALVAARASLALLDIGPEDEETGSAHHFTLGRVLEGLGESKDAFEEYLEAVMAGGRQNRWPARADTALADLFDKEFSSRAKGRSLVDYCRGLVAYDGPVFTDVTLEAGFEGRNESRVAWGDYDGDGHDDLLLNGRVLMRNRGDGTFYDVTTAAGIGGTGTNGAVWADIENDGDLDFYATCGATEGERTDRLWVNTGNGSFADHTGAMTDHYTTEGAAWGDFDGDGLVDLYLASYERPRTEKFTEYGVGFSDILYRNVGLGTFVDATTDAGIVPPFCEHLSGRGVNWGDYDNDGDQDIFVSNYRLQENFLWNNKGDGTFENVAPGLGVSGRETDGWWGHTIGSEWGDYDNDGDLDIACANLAHPRYIEVSDKSMLLRNEGAPFWMFDDVRAEAGIKYAETHSDPSWGDVDSDGDLDLFITSIYPDCGSFLYRNNGRGRFEDVTWLAGVRSFNGWGAAMSDYDNDGDLDIAVGSGSGFRLFRNDTSRRGAGHWLEVKVAGTASNAAGIGARVTVTDGRRTQIREIQGGKGTTSQHSLTAFFGLGRSSDPVNVEVRFVGGRTVVRSGVPVDRRIVMSEAE
jgi:tetratricopeptide (TPR) repeat protein